MNRLAVAAQTAVAEGVPLSMAAESFDGVDLSGLDLMAALGHKVSFVQALLVRTDLSFSYLEAADFTGADLSHAKLPCSWLNDSDFTEADLTGTDLRGSTFYRSRFEGSSGGVVRLDVPTFFQATLFPSCEGWKLAVERMDGDHTELNVSADLIGAQMDWIAREAELDDDVAGYLAASAEMISFHIMRNADALAATRWAAGPDDRQNWPEAG